MSEFRSMRDAFETTWQELHAEKCTNMDDCASFGGTKECSCPRPPELTAVEPMAIMPCAKRADGLHDFRHEVCDCGASREDTLLEKSEGDA